MPCPDESIASIFTTPFVRGGKDEQKPPLAERERERERVRVGKIKKPSPGLETGCYCWWRGLVLTSVTALASALLAFGDLEFEARPSQASGSRWPGFPNSGRKDRAALRCNEAVAFFTVEPLDCTLDATAFLFTLNNWVCHSLLYIHPFYSEACAVLEQRTRRE